MGHPWPGALPVTPEGALFLDKARRCLVQARMISSLSIDDAVGRSAYLACFHAAQALIFERERRVVKTHNGVHTEWQRLTRPDRDMAPDLRGFLSRSFRLKVVADYGLDPLDRVTADQALEAITMAERLIAHVEAKLAAPEA